MWMVNGEYSMSCIGRDTDIIMNSMHIGSSYEFVHHSARIAMD